MLKITQVDEVQSEIGKKKPEKRSAHIHHQPEKSVARAFHRPHHGIAAHFVVPAEYHKRTQYQIRKVQNVCVNVHQIERARRLLRLVANVIDGKTDFLQNVPRQDDHELVALKLVQIENAGHLIVLLPVFEEYDQKQPECCTAPDDRFSLQMHEQNERKVFDQNDRENRQIEVEEKE